jgi:hypothetical protein
VSLTYENTPKKLLITPNYVINKSPDFQFGMRGFTYERIGGGNSRQAGSVELTPVTQ